ncbi:MAG: hypothetical protein EXR36_02505 [Betaproteobacteria bacterium]|nr:hypothetical protein [Betaproteobacteria bacterium]
MIVTVLAGLWGGLSVHAENQENVDASIQNKLDPTDFRSRLEFRTEHQRLRDDGSRNLVLPRLDYAASKQLAFRVELPFVADTPKNQPSDSGLGDLLGRMVYRMHRGDGYAWVVGGEVVFDTASEGLGAGTNIVTALTFMSIDVPKYKSVLFPLYQYSFNAGGGPAIGFSTIRASVMTKWPERYYTFVEPTLYADHEHGSRVAGTFEVEVGRFVSSDAAIWARPGVGIRKHVMPRVYDWNFEVGVRFFLN